MAERFGLSTSVLEQVKAVLLKTLKRKIYFSVSVFGSRATGKQKKYSDLDVWIESAPPLTTEELATLRDEFVESDLPIKIDLITPDNCLPEYRDRISSEKVLWFP